MNYDKIIKSLENELELYSFYNRKLGYKKFRFRPYQDSLLNEYPLMVILLLPFLPFISALQRFRYTSDCNSIVSFIISKKSEKIIGNGNESSKFGLIPNGFRTEFSFLYIFSCYKCIWFFFSRFWRDIWFYPSVLFIPDMLGVAFFIDRRNIETMRITNHYDRWAYLISVFCKDKGIKFELYQHGLLDEEFQPKYKLLNVSFLSCFDKKSEIIFESKIISNIHKVIISPPKLKLSTEKSVNSILLVGTVDSNFVKFERNIINELLKDTEYKVYFKAHPLNINSHRGVEQSPKFEVLTEECIIPRVDILIHTGSTFCLEYKNTEPNVFAIDLKDYINSDVKSVIKNVSEKIGVT
jgi:hypothetical protein